jgi:hypothetical protein
MGAGPAQYQFLGLYSVEQDPVRFYVAIPPALKTTFQWVVFVLRTQRAVIAQRFDDWPELCRVFATPFLPVQIPFKFGCSRYF